MSIPVLMDNAVMHVDADCSGKHILFVEEENGTTVWKIATTAPLENEKAPETTIPTTNKETLSREEVGVVEKACVPTIEDLDEEALEFFSD